jgi:phosphatidylserine/phosphatidylglycerophosphate/cardiolipin synthase-like enzyme
MTARSALHAGLLLVWISFAPSLGACAAAAPAPRPNAEPVPMPAELAVPPAPAVQLVETRPVESGLGNPALPEARTVWLDLIRGAKTSLAFEEFYLSNWPGEPMQAVLEEIGRAAKRGVHVRLLLDSHLHRTYPEPADSLASVPGIEVRLIDMGKVAGGVQHSKYFIVDDAIVYLGSQNFDWRSLEHIHELGVLIRDPAVARTFSALFDMDWKELAGEAGNVAHPDTSWSPPKGVKLSPRATVPFRLARGAGDVVELTPSFTPLSTLADSTWWDRAAIVRLIDAAKSEIVVQLLTYAISERRGERDEAIDAALRRAAARGVQVKMVISDWEADNQRIADVQSLSRVPNVAIKLSTVPEWSGGYIPFARVEHLKYMVVDSLSTWVGTDNWEPGYFHGTRNVAVTMKNRPIALEARAIFDASWRAPGAKTVRADTTYAPKVHGSNPPPGTTAYGR